MAILRCLNLIWVEDFNKIFQTTFFTILNFVQDLK